jgi:hypothetical protein
LETTGGVGSPVGLSLFLQDKKNRKEGMRKHTMIADTDLFFMACIKNKSGYFSKCTIQK